MEQDLYHLANFLGLLQKMEKELDELGAEKFWKGAGVREQKAREAFQAMFFIMGLKKLMDMEWLVLQKPDVEFPDFNIAHFGGNSEKPEFDIWQFEHAIIPEMCSGFEDAYSIVSRKIFEKRYAISDTEKINLLIFVNHEHGEEWIAGFINKIGRYKPFTEIWTTRLLAKNKEIVGTEITRIRPFSPYLSTRVLFSDPDLLKQRPLPDYFELNEKGEGIIKEDFRKKLRIMTLKKKLGKT